MTTACGVLAEIILHSCGAGHRVTSEITQACKLHFVVIIWSATWNGSVSILGFRQRRFLLVPGCVQRQQDGAVGALGWRQRFIRYDRSRQHWKFRVKGQKALCPTGPLPLWRQFNDTATLVISLKLTLCYFVFYELFSFTFLLLLSFLYSSVVFSERRLPAAVALKMSLWDYFRSRWKNETLKQIL